jgi:hypothetical protein
MAANAAGTAGNAKENAFSTVTVRSDRVTMPTADANGMTIHVVARLK